MDPTDPGRPDAALEADQVFELAAEVFRVMSAPMRLKIISALCNGEKNVGQLLAEIRTTQPNMSQHLNTLYQAGVVGKRRDGVQIYYRIINDRVSTCAAPSAPRSPWKPTATRPDARHRAVKLPSGLILTKVMLRAPYHAATI